MLNQRIFGKHLNHSIYPKHLSVVQTNAIEDSKHLKQDLKSAAQTFAKCYSDLAESLLKNLQTNLKWIVLQYYKKTRTKR